MLENAQKYFEKILSKVEGWLESFITMIPNFLLALLVIFITILVAKTLRGLAYRMMQRITRNEAIDKLTASIVFFLMVTLGLFISLRILNLDKTVTSLLAGLGIVGLAMGFAFKDIVSNFISGVYLAIKSPVNVGDIVEYQDAMGVVKEIGLRASRIKTFQGQDVIIPNRLIIEDKYTHFTINKERRIDLEVGVSYGDDLEKVEQVTLNAIHKIPYLKEDKQADFYYKEFGDSAIIFTVRYWVDYLPGNYLIYLRALSQGIKNIKKAYDQNQITITFPIRTIDFGIKGGESLADMLVEADKK
ncbi:MAG TPA: mechanosensitive ion channel protein MscS [Bacteroidales bacterium]|jgi:small conductance mechanosensitive channel|nr:mechanosensitive ion channel protein MscS [Bacteroidales bacterium]